MDGSRTTTEPRRTTEVRRAAEFRKTAIVAGGLYILATAAGIGSQLALGSTLAGIGRPRRTRRPRGARVRRSADPVRDGGQLCRDRLHAVPVLRRDAGTPLRQSLALWYVGTRITESALFLVAILGMLSLLALSQGIADAGDQASLASFEPLQRTLQMVTDHSAILAQSVFCIGAMMLYYLLYVSRRVPRWLSGWGLVAVPLMLIAGFLLPVTDDPDSTVLYAPFAVQEMVFAVWLIVRGFREPAVAPAPAAASAGDVAAAMDAPASPAPVLKEA